MDSKTIMSSWYIAPVNKKIRTADFFIIELGSFESLERQEPKYSICLNPGLTGLAWY